MPVAVSTTAMTRDDLANFKRQATSGSIWGENPNDMASGRGFFSTTMLIDLTPGSEVLTVTGTSAPFSAMTGSFRSILSETSLWSVPSNSTRASLGTVEVNAFLGQVRASKYRGRPSKAVIASAPCINGLRLVRMHGSPAARFIASFFRRRFIDSIIKKVERNSPPTLTGCAEKTVASPGCEIPEFCWSLP